MKLFQKMKLAALALICISTSSTVFASTSLSTLNTHNLKSLNAKAATSLTKSKVASELNSKLPVMIEPGARLKKVEYQDNFRLTIYMTNKTADSYSSDETDSLNRFAVEKIHPFFCDIFPPSKATNKPSLYIDIVDKKGNSFYTSLERYDDVCPSE